MSSYWRDRSRVIVAEVIAEHKGVITMWHRFVLVDLKSWYKSVWIGNTLITWRTEEHWWQIRELSVEFDCWG